MIRIQSFAQRLKILKTTLTFHPANSWLLSRRVHGKNQEGIKSQQKLLIT